MRIRFFNHIYSDDILGKAWTFRIPGLDPEDIAQELDIILWQKLRKFRGNNGASERTFAVRVMQNRLLDLAKAANRKKRYGDSHHFVFSQLSAQEANQIGLDSEEPFDE